MLFKIDVGRSLSIWAGCANCFINDQLLEKYVGGTILDAQLFALCIEGAWSKKAVLLKEGELPSQSDRKVCFAVTVSVSKKQGHAFIVLIA